MPDIDIDFENRDLALSHFDHIRASRIDDGNLTKHNTGVYFHSVPINAEKNVCSIPYTDAEDQGFFKIDFLNASVYKGIQNEEHLINLMNTEPLWDLLEQDDFVNLLFHVNGHGNILRQMKPKSIEQLAAVLAMIRPAKRYLIGQDWNTVMKEVWSKPEGDEYFFKKSHATAYAVAIAIQMNLICEGISYSYS
jgi:DNA polymerase III alpha subunit